MLLWVVAFALPAELVALLVLPCFVFWPPLPAFVAVWGEVAVDPPLCSVDADCTTVCDWPVLAPPPS